MFDFGINFKIFYIVLKYVWNYVGKYKNFLDFMLRKFFGFVYGIIGDMILVNFGNDLILYNNIKEIYFVGGN